MLNKYLTALRTKYADFGFGKEVFDRVALQRLKTIEKAEDIETDIASPDVMLLLMKEMQGSNDTLRSRNAQIQRELEDSKKNQPSNQPNQTPQEPESELAKQLQTLTNLVTTMQTERAAEKKKARTDAVLAQVHEKMKSNGCTNDFIRNITLRGIEVGESDTVDSLAEKYRSVYDQNCKDAYGEGYVPPRGNGNGGGETDQAEVTRILQERGLLPKTNN